MNTMQKLKELSQIRKKNVVDYVKRVDKLKKEFMFRIDEIDSNHFSFCYDYKLDIGFYNKGTNFYGDIIVLANDENSDKIVKNKKHIIVYVTKNKMNLFIDEAKLINQKLIKFKNLIHSGVPDILFEKDELIQFVQTLFSKKEIQKIIPAKARLFPYGMYTR